jgi:2-phospho-L-lactate guanylyltransferase
VRPVQATVATYSSDSRSGSVLRDDGVELPFAAAAFDGSGLRLLRPGQRVAIRVVDGEVVALALPTVDL